MISNVNIPNYNSQISNLPKTAIVETNAVFERNAIRPIVAGRIPQNILELIMPHVENHERILQAALTDNHELVVEAFLHDPLIRGRASDAEIRNLALEMLKRTL